MAENDSGGGGDNSPAGTDRKKQIKNEHVLIAVGIVTLIVLVLLSKKGSSANANNQQNAADSQLAQQNSELQQELQDAELQAEYGYGATGSNNPYSWDYGYSQQPITGPQGPVGPQGAQGATGAGSGPSSTSSAVPSSPLVDVFNGEDWSGIAAGANEEWINEEGEYYYGTQGPSSSAPFGTDINGTPLQSASAWRKQA